MILGQFEMSLQTNEDFIGIYGVPFLHGQPIDFYYEQHELIKKMCFLGFVGFCTFFLGFCTFF